MKQVSNLIAFIFPVIFLNTVSAQKKPIDLNSLDEWELYSERRISNDGKWVSFGISPANTKNRVLYLKNMQTQVTQVFTGASQGRFSSDNKCYVFLQPAVQKEQPDTTMVIQLASGQLEKLPGISSFGWADSNSAIRTWFSGINKQQLKVSAANGDVLLTQNNTLRFALLPNGEGIFFVVQDSMGRHLVFSNLTQKVPDTVAKNQDDIGGLYMEGGGKKIAFTMSRDKQTGLFLYDYEEQTLTQLGIQNHTDDTGYVINADTKFRFLKNRNHMLYTTQYVYPARRIQLTGGARVEVWSTSDRELYTKQKASLPNQLNKDYYFSYNLSTGKTVQLTSVELDELQLPGADSSSYVLTSTTFPYQAQRQWDPVVRKDAYLVHLETGERKLVARNTAADFSFSPFGRYIVWFDMDKQHYYTYSLKTGTIQRIDKGITDALADTSPNLPQGPEPFGIAAWEEQDRSLLITTSHNVWKVTSSGQLPPLNITAFHQKKGLRFSYYAHWGSASFYTNTDTLLFQAVADKNKDAGFFSVTMSARPQVRPLIFGPYAFSYPGMDIASRGRQIVFSFGNTGFYGLFYTSDLLHFDTLHILNPERKNVNWYQTELVRWPIQKGVYTEGYLVKPEDFDPARKYPMIVWLYENGHARNVNSYIPQDWSSSYINFGFYASNGYVVFVPDIQYATGKPGESAYETVMSGVRFLQKQNWLDTSKMGLQGHSWGGYQVAYILTRTKLFKAASAGAVVVNMTSAYGGLRMNNGGESRQWIYEKNQSRLGASLWQNPGVYIKNSPLFGVDKIETPLLLMHNEKDGSVPLAQGIEFFSALKRLNKKAWLLNYPEENHVIRNPVNRKDFTIRMFQFFEHYLKGQPAPAWMIKGIPAIEAGFNKGY
ncbi:MAG TPA: prolyl oligopeptidase family serine peptidase [Flavisolibacter sp.]|nr:prolyl oligopeptidase family serine peptidase [Flavisolibacter sp.]